MESMKTRSSPKEVTAVENMEKVGDARMSDKRFKKTASTADSKQHEAETNILPSRRRPPRCR